jgi:uncharacterized protein YllA (UPF0747 family)
LRFEDLPEIPQPWLDFLNSKLPFIPAVYEIPMLPDRMTAFHNRMAENRAFRILADAAMPALDPATSDVQRLLQPGSVAVTARIQAGLFGGPLSQILKCLTVIRVCEELAKYQIAAIPVCWFDESAPSTVPTGSIQLLDKESEIHYLQIQKSEAADFMPNDPLPRNQIEALLFQVENIGQGTFDSEVLDAIRAAFGSNETMASASANLLAALMQEWGMVVLNASQPSVHSIVTQAMSADRVGAEKASIPLLAQNLVLPAIACVVDPCEIEAYARILPYFDERDLPKPMAWPQCSATLLDARSRRILERLDLNWIQLFSGEEKVASEIRNAAPDTVFQTLESLKSEVAQRINKMRDPIPPGGEYTKTADACSEKIIYQLQKLLDRCMDARKRQAQATSRQIHKLCNRLAPNRQLQERELGGIQFPLRYSRSGLRSLCNKLDIMRCEHQLISLD